MKLRNLGKSGLRVSEVGLGCNNFGGRTDLEASRRVIDHAIELGVTFFDTADIYGNQGGSENILGEVLGSRRKNIILATKFGLPMGPGEDQKGASRRYIVSAVEASLRRLRCEWIDLYQLHTPDPLTPIEETLRALDDLIRSGKVRYVGCSNLPAWQVADAMWISKELGTHHFVSVQDEYSLVERGPEKELLPMAKSFGLGVLPYFPLASGLLTGKYKRNATAPQGSRLEQNKGLAQRYMTNERWSLVEGLEAFAKERGHTLLDLAFGWLLAHPEVSSVIAGATKPEQLEANVKAASWTLSNEELDSVNRLGESR